MSRYFEEFKVGDVFETAGVTVTESMIVDFALTYDPQPFHIDALAAAKGPFGSLIASGFQTLALSFRLWHQTGVFHTTSKGGFGMDEIRWTRPVRPGDTLRVRVEVVETRASRNNPATGVVRFAYTTLNQHGEVVQTLTANQLVQRRTETVAV